MLCSPLLISGVLALGSSPWDKYMLAPGPDRTQVPTHWVHTPAGEEPPQPSNGCVGGSVTVPVTPATEVAVNTLAEDKAAAAAWRRAEVQKGTDKRAAAEAEATRRSRCTLLRDS